ncbi:SDR family oxidoreductase [Nostoc sp. NIES-2111]
MTKLILITGISRGLGYVLTEKFIQEGHTVIGCARSQTIVEKLTHRFGNPHNFAVVDVADEGQVKAWAEDILKEYEPPDLLINNAAIANHPALLWEVPSEEFSQLIDINIIRSGAYNPLFCTRNDRKAAWDYCQLKFQLGTFNFTPSCTLLCFKMGN